MKSDNENIPSHTQGMEVRVVIAKSVGGLCCGTKVRLEINTFNVKSQLQEKQKI